MFETLFSPARDYLVGSAIGIISLILARVFVFDSAVRWANPLSDTIDERTFTLSLLATIAIVMMLYGPVRDELAPHRRRTRPAGDWRRALAPLRAPRRIAIAVCI